MKIFIVEDEPSLRELIQCSLEKERYVVETASDFNSALRKVEDYDYDCILLDIMLPDGSGLDLLERLKALHKRENVIIISAHRVSASAPPSPQGDSTHEPCRFRESPAADGCGANASADRRHARCRPSWVS